MELKHHKEWWQNLEVSERYRLMKKYRCYPVTNKGVKRIFKNELPD